MNLLLAGFDAATAAALAEAGARPAVWLRKGEVVVGELDGATEVLNLTDLTRLRFTPQPPGPNADWTLLARARDAAREMFRRSLDRKTNHTPVNSWVTAESRLNLILYRLYDVLTAREIDSVAFNNIPHEPPLIVLYHLARAMGLRTLMTNQSPFAGRFFAFETIEDYGRFVTSRAGSPAPVSLPATPSSPFYMRNIPSYDSFRHHLKNLGNVIEIALRLSSLPFGGDAYRFSKAYYKLIYFSRTRTFRQRYYTAEADFKKPYIYVPLHLQPELTIDVLGGAYGDHVLAIEELSAVLPSGWLLYVKENPKQTAVAREAPFFQRLEALSNVRLVRQDTDSFELIRHARAVATWSGTAGWEALLMGKPTILFGLAWYRRLPGVFEWQHGLRPEALAGPDRGRLAAAFADLTRHMREGLVDPNYAVLVADYDARANGRKVARALLEALQPATAPLSELEFS
jgi:hypothetical protein